MDNIENRMVLCGCLQELPVYSHENHGHSFYRFTLEVERLSGTIDYLPVMAEETLLNTIDLSGGQMLRVEGQIRSYNSHSRTGRKLMISVFAQTITACEEEPENLAVLCGTICKEPTYRRTPLGREICDVMLAVDRHYHRTDYLPCILWGRTAQQVSRFPVGTVLRVEGRLQSREYIKMLENGSETRVAYEISALSAQAVIEQADEDDA